MLHIQANPEKDNDSKKLSYNYNKFDNNSFDFNLSNNDIFLKTPITFYIRIKNKPTNTNKLNYEKINYNYFNYNSKFNKNYKFSKNHFYNISSKKEYCEELKKLIEVNTLNKYFFVFNSLISPSEINHKNNLNLIVFKNSNTPIWEDNLSAGCVSVELSSNYVDYIWENLMVKMLIFPFNISAYESFILGLVCKFKNNKYIIDIWINNFNKEMCLNFEEYIKKEFKLEINYISSYKFKI